MNRRCLGAVLAAAMLLPVASAAEAGSHRVGEFIALSYNVAGLPEGISGSEPATNSPLISPLLSDYDLVLLQENWADPIEQAPVFFYHHEIVAEANHPYQSEPAPHPMGTDLRRFPSGPTLVSDGLNRLSRFPFGTLHRVMWEACFGDLAFVVAEEAVSALGLGDVVEELGLDETVDGGAADCMAQKGFSVARTRFGPGVEVDVYNLHADAGGHPSDVAARADNFRQLAELILDFSAGRPVILGGDTNLSTAHSNRERAELDRRTWERFQAVTGLSDVCSVVNCRADSEVIDKFAFRSGGGVELTPRRHRFEREKFQREDGEPLSDHDPLAVTFRWRVAP